MCYVETHSCACTEIVPGKIVHRRAIACPANVSCESRASRGLNPLNWTSIHVKNCADFHKGLAPSVPYRCPGDRLDRERDESRRAVLSDAIDLFEVLEYIDEDYVTFFDHVDKYIGAYFDGSYYHWSEKSLSCGEVDSDADEYVHHRYQTGWMFNKLGDGTLVRVPDTHNPRGMIDNYTLPADPEHPGWEPPYKTPRRTTDFDYDVEDERVRRWIAPAMRPVKN